MSGVLLLLAPTSGPFRALDDSGRPLAGAVLRFFRAGTTQYAPVYDENLDELEQPIVADDTGTFPVIVLDPAVEYRAVLTTAAGVLRYDVDPYVWDSFEPNVFRTPCFQVVSDAGRIVPGARLTLYSAGTETKAIMYHDAALEVPWPNPLSANAGGTYPAIYLDPEGGYRVELDDDVIEPVPRGVPAVISIDNSQSVFQRSTDGGASWEQITVATGYRDIAYSRSQRRFCAVGDGGKYAVSDDGGKTWTEGATGFPNVLIAVEYLDQFGLWAARGRQLDGGNPELVLYSDDAETWHAGTLQTTISDANSRAWIVDAPELGVAFSFGQTLVPHITRDGKNWQAVSTSPAVGGGSVCYSRELELLVIGDANGRILTSPNGSTWTQRLSSAGGLLFAAAAPGPLIIIGDNDRVYASTDGETFSPIDVTVFAGDISAADMLWLDAYTRFVGVGRIAAGSTAQLVYSAVPGGPWAVGHGYSNAEGIVRIAAGTAPDVQALLEVPTITSLDPPAVEQGSGAFSLTINGTGFHPRSIAFWDGAPRATMFLSETSLAIAVAADDILAQGSVDIEVFNPAPGGGRSAPEAFAITQRTYATLDSSTHDTTITLSNGDLTATRAAATNQWSSARSTIGKASGKWYWEITIVRGVTAGTTARHLHGVAPSTLLTSQFPGQTATSYGYIQSTGNKFNNNTSSAYGNTYTEADVIGVALDMDSGKVWFAKNGVWQAGGDPAAGTGEAFAGLTGTQYAAIGLFYSNTSAPAPTGIVTVNFGASSFAYSPPAGFNAGLYQ